VLQDHEPTGTLTVCLDDFPKTAWTEGGSVLRDHGVYATYFACGGLAGTVFEDQAMFDLRDLEQVLAEGHEIGCHTYDHRSCLRSSRAEFEAAILDNQRFLTERLGDVRLVSFAYPYGDTTPWAKRCVARRFASARGVHPGLNRRRLDLGQLSAVGLESRKMSGTPIEEHVERAAASKGWLIVYTHDVRDRPSAYGCRPRDLDRLLRAAKASGLQVLPMKGALATRAFGEPASPSYATT
jgi:peptidoglycan/xylan/chitin deacetylase (PgdA/CDA1 family)